MSETATATAGMTVERMFRRKPNTTKITSTAEIRSVRSTSRREPRIGGVRSETIENSIPPGHGGLQLGEQGADAVDGIDDIGVGLAKDDHHDGRLPVYQPAGPQILHRILHVGNIRQPHRRPGPVGYDEGPVLLGGAELVVGLDLPGPGVHPPAVPWAG